MLLPGCPADRPDPGQPDAQAPIVSAAPSASAAPGIPVATAAPTQPSTPITDAGPDDGPYVSGATWATCMRGFRPESTVDRDLIRLGMLCGPYHGMRRLGEPMTGRLEAGKTVRHGFQARKGQCFRAFVIAAEPVAALSIRALGANGKPLAKTSSASRWAVLDPQGAWCVEEDAAAAIEVETSAGQGDYAMQLWLLP